MRQKLVDVVVLLAAQTRFVVHIARVEYECFDRVIDEEVAADELQPIGLPLAEARLAKVFYDALAFHRRLEQDEPYLLLECEDIAQICDAAEVVHVERGQLVVLMARLLLLRLVRLN